MSAAQVNDKINAVVDDIVAKEPKDSKVVQKSGSEAADPGVNTLYFVIDPAKEEVLFSLANIVGSAPAHGLDSGVSFGHFSGNGPLPTTDRGNVNIQLVHEPGLGPPATATLTFDSDPSVVWFSEVGQFTGRDTGIFQFPGGTWQAC